MSRCTDQIRYDVNMLCRGSWAAAWPLVRDFVSRLAAAHSALATRCEELVRQIQQYAQSQDRRHRQVSLSHQPLSVSLHHCTVCMPIEEALRSISFTGLSMDSLLVAEGIGGGHCGRRGRHHQCLDCSPAGAPQFQRTFSVRLCIRLCCVALQRVLVPNCSIHWPEVRRSVAHSTPSRRPHASFSRCVLSVRRVKRCITRAAANSRRRAATTSRRANSRRCAAH